MTAATVRSVPASVDLRWAVRVVVALLPHPGLWATAVRQAFVLAAPGWWRRPPFLPLPAPDYLRFRLETIYGGEGDQAIEPADLLEYLRWCRDFPDRGG